MLKESDPDIHIVEWETHPGPVDITLMGASVGARSLLAAAAGALLDPRSGAVALLLWEASPDDVAEALSRGCSGCIDAASSGPVLASAIRRMHRGETVVSSSLGMISHSPPDHHTRRGVLSARELDMMVLIAEGFSNVEIAQRMYLSINTVKTYIRSAYRKLGIQRRPEAVRWGIEQGLHRTRIASPPDVALTDIDVPRSAVPAKVGAVPLGAP